MIGGLPGRFTRVRADALNVLACALCSARRVIAASRFEFRGLGFELQDLRLGTRE